MGCNCGKRSTKYEGVATSGDRKTFASMAEARTWVARQGGGSVRTVTSKDPAPV